MGMKATFLSLLTSLLLLAACAELPPTEQSEPSKAPANPSSTPSIATLPSPATLPLLACPDNESPLALASPVAPTRGHLVRTDYGQLPNWEEGVTARTWSAFQASCQSLAQKDPWQASCQAATQLGPFDAATMRRFFEAYFDPWQVTAPDGGDQGLITGYYEPLLHGSLIRTPTYRYPLYSPPPDLLTIDLGDIAPDLKGRRLRGRVQGQRVVPYFSRADIELEDSPLQGNELLWVDNAVELFFLQIQGSGVVILDNGQTVHVGYADQNGYPFRSIARYLVDHHLLSLAQTSLQGIKAWARQHPDVVQTLLNKNPSFVFFRLLPDDLTGPLGTLGVPLTGEASLAVDTRVITLGAPVYLSTAMPGTQTPLQRLMMAQDTGGAIHGAVRADFFWGFGAQAEQKAGHMKEPGRLWVLYPRHHDPSFPH